MTEVDKFIYIPFLIALVVGYIFYRLSRKNIYTEERNKEAKPLYKFLKDAKKSIETEGITFAYSFITVMITQELRDKITSFGYTLQGSERKRFERDCEKLFKFCKKQTTILQGIKNIHDRPSDNDIESKIHTAIKLIDKLLNYTKARRRNNFYI